ncbi:hypothetical protein NQ317_003196 [Molorchus minor]|uniref:Importin N-terminal domain-containing protein n=1 Tax=Molorchus minor TaxID=1323400 RepID=A0ABQ9IVS6_9CUCU|nr:hypothetical protein NQ317_003196 [Molorchus minor]
MPAVNKFFNKLIEKSVNHPNLKLISAIVILSYGFRMNWGEWRPQESILKNVEETLQLALVPNSEAQKTVQDRLNVMQNLTDFPNYLLFILGNSSFSESVRSLGGILLKNNILTVYSSLSQEDNLKFRNECLRLLKDPSREVRISISNVIVIIAKDHLKTWHELIPYLMKCFVSQDEHSEVALTTLFKVCEELINKQKPQEEAYPITHEVFPKLVEFVALDTCTIRQDIIRLTNQFLQDYFPIMKQSIDTASYLRSIMQLANTSDVDLQKYICHTFVIYVENQEECLLPHLHDIICYLMEKCQHDDQEVALQACEFWLATTKLSTCKDILSPYVDKLLPILLKNMKYSAAELNMIKDSLGADANNKDLSKDISPFHLKDRGNVGDAEEYYSDEDLDEQAEDFDDFYVGWTLRKCSAASLDSIAVKFGEELLTLLIPLISEMLRNSDYIIKESAILALGAVAEGCMNGLKNELPNLIRFLICCMNDEHSIVRVITCWTLSRYVSWIVNFHSENPEEFFVPVMTVLLKHFIDENKRVQRAAISAFCIFQEDSQMKLVPYIDFILEGFKYGFERFHCRSLYLLYDAIGVLAQAVGNHLSKEEYVSKLLPPLMKKFTELNNFYDDHFIAVLECLSNVIPSLEVAFLPFSETVYLHCLQLINDSLIACINYQQYPNEYDPPDKEPMNVAHDVLYSMALGLKTHFVKYVTNSNLIYLLYTTMQDGSNLIRQTSIALYGELIGLCYPFLASNVNDYIPLIIKNLDENVDGVCNNAAWVIGKLCSVMGSNIQQFLPEILNAFVHILRAPTMARTMHKTVAISLCIIFFVCPEVTVPEMDNIVKNCCMLVRNVRDSDEKDLAFRGLCSIILRHPEFNKTYFIFFFVTRLLHG